MPHPLLLHYCCRFCDETSMVRTQTHCWVSIHCVIHSLYQHNEPLVWKTRITHTQTKLQIVMNENWVRMFSRLWNHLNTMVSAAVIFSKFEHLFSATCLILHEEKSSWKIPALDLAGDKNKHPVRGRCLFFWAENDERQGSTSYSVTQAHHVSQSLTPPCDLPW